MKEIKYRAWDVVFKKMFPIACLYFDKSSDFVGVYTGDEENDEWTVIKSEHIKIMQYTGLKDVNGVEIYEGDILYALDNNEEYVGVVEYDSVGRFVTTGFPHVTSGDCFVKGNIYENPEILENN